MLPTELMRQIRRLQLRARRAVQTLLGGEYHSVFKGTGLSFEEVREYQPGDDVRSIDWNVTARMSHPFIKRFVEERELTVLLLADVSGSHRFGTQQHAKRTVAAELAALVAFSAIANNDRVGLIASTDTVERFVPPAKGSRHVLRLLRDILFFEPEKKSTSLRAGLEYLNQVQRRRAIVFLVSDFLDEGYEQAFRLVGRKHDLIAVRVADEREEALPDVGLLQVEDAETGRQMLVDTHSPELRKRYFARARERHEAVRRLTRSCQVDLIDVSTDGKHFDALVRFFQMRERRRRHGQ
jgi:uncharacterized protein (DUF58 family)